MAKLRGPLFSLDAKGTFADRLTIRKRNKLHIILDYNKPGDRTPFKSSPKQKDQRAIIGLVTIRWNCMTPAEKAPWNTLAKTSREPLTGYHLFLRTAQTDLYQYLGLAGYWSFNYNLEAIIPDLSGQANNSTLKPTYPSDCPTLDPGQNLKFGLAGKFDGVDDYVEVPDSPSLNPTEEITVEAWLFLKSNTGKTQNAVRKDTQYLIGWIPSNYTEISWYIETGGTWKQINCSKTPTQLEGKWFYFAETYKSNGEFKGYLNGLLDNSTILEALPIDTSSNVLLFGCEPIGAYWNGLIGEVRIYSRALTPQEILDHYIIGKEMFG